MPIAIEVDNISKKFLIAHQRVAGYKTLRETLSSGTYALFERLRSLVGHEGFTSKKKEEFWALSGITFNVQRGEAVGIIGRNGAGKSTLLKILSRITEPTSGRALLRGRLASLLEVGTGFHPELTGRENIFLNGAILGMSRAEMRHRFDEIVEFSGVEKFLDTPVKHFSSGMHVRLAFSVAAHLDPDILIVDEVLSVGDLDFQQKCLGKMQKTATEGRTVICVSHDLAAIHRICNRAILLGQGKVIADGDTGEVIRTYIALGHQDPTEYTQPHDASKPIHLRRVLLSTASGERSLEFKYHEPITIEIEYEVNERIKDCAVWFGLRTMEDVLAFGSADCDVDAKLLEVREPGYYRCAVQLPEKWLNAGRYYLVIGITQYSPLSNYDRVEACMFSVLDVGTPERTRTGHSRPGVLQPYLTWSTARGEPDAH